MTYFIAPAMQAACKSQLHRIRTCRESPEPFRGLVIFAAPAAGRRTSKYLPLFWGWIMFVAWCVTNAISQQLCLCFGRKGDFCMNCWIISEAAENQVPEHRNVFLPPDRMVFQREDKDKLSSDAGVIVQSAYQTKSSASSSPSAVVHAKLYKITPAHANALECSSLLNSTRHDA
jgi:hypothetical protein